MTEELNALPVPAVMEASKAMLQKQLYVVFTTPTGSMGPILEKLEEHLAFQVGLEREGILFAAGPMWTDDEMEWRGDGMVVIRADSREAAEAIAATDPMHRAGARRFTVRPWMINEGSMTLRINLSSQSISIA